MARAGRAYLWLQPHCERRNQSCQLASLVVSKSAVAFSRTLIFDTVSTSAAASLSSAVRFSSADSSIYARRHVSPLHRALRPHTMEGSVASSSVGMNSVALRAQVARGRREVLRRHAHPGCPCDAFTAIARSSTDSCVRASAQSAARVPSHLTGDKAASATTVSARSATATAPLRAIAAILIALVRPVAGLISADERTSGPVTKHQPKHGG